MILDLSSICHEGFKIKFTDPEIGILLRNSVGNAGATPGVGSLGNHGSCSDHCSQVDLALLRIALKVE